MKLGASWPLGLGLALALAIFAPHQAAAHALGQSYIFLSVYDDSIEGHFEITVADANTALGLDFRTDGTVTEAEVARHIQAIRDYLSERVRVSADGVPVDVRFTDHHLSTIPLAQYVIVEFTLDGLPDQPEYLDLHYDVLFDVDSDHRGLLVIWHNWRTGTFNNEGNVSLIFSPGGKDQRLDLTKSSVWRGFLALVELGVHHIWVGIDHILFLLALLLPSVVRREGGHWVVNHDFRGAMIRVIKVVTVFTLAHSITLSLAALGVVQVPSRLVESIIAVSIAIAALDIVYPVFRGRIWIVVFVFGLFHGFGFASVLAEMGIPSKYMALSLLGFNVGVELGQAVIVILIFPILYLLGTRPFYVRYVLQPAAVLLIFVSLYWFVERAFEIDMAPVVWLRQLVGA